MNILMQKEFSYSRMHEHLFAVRVVHDSEKSVVLMDKPWNKVEVLQDKGEVNIVDAQTLKWSKSIRG